MKKIIIDSSILHGIDGSNTIFKRSSITFFSARSSEEILNLHGLNKADLIVTDASLPLMGGAKLCSQIRRDPELKYVSVILLCETEASSLQCLEAGANVVMRKPVDYGELLWKVSELLVVPQRKDMRALLRVTITGIDGSSSFFAKSQDISLSGMQLETDHVLKQGDRLQCAFNIGHSEVTMSCVVERGETAVSGIYRYGVRFMNCDTKSLVIVDQFIKGGIKH